MSQPQDSPGASTPATPAAAAPDVSQQIAQLTQAVNRLVDAQQRQQPPRRDVTNISGDIPGGQAPQAAVDVSKLSPLQQITLGLRDAKPVGPVRPTDDAPPQGAD